MLAAAVLLSSEKPQTGQLPLMMVCLTSKQEGPSYTATLIKWVNMVLNVMAFVAVFRDSVQIF